MDFRMKITLTLPEEMIKTMGITEDTLFITTYENGQIHVEPYDEDDLAEDFPDEEEFEEEFEEDYDDDAYSKALTDTLVNFFERGTRQGMKTVMHTASEMPTRDCLTTTITAAESSNSMIILLTCLAVHFADVKTDTNQ